MPRVTLWNICRMKFWQQQPDMASRHLWPCLWAIHGKKTLSGWRKTSCALHWWPRNSLCGSESTRDTRFMACTLWLPNNCLWRIGVERRGICPGSIPVSLSHTQLILHTYRFLCGAEDIHSQPTIILFIFPRRICRRQSFWTYGYVFSIRQANNENKIQHAVLTCAHSWSDAHQVGQYWLARILDRMHIKLGNSKQGNVFFKFYIWSREVLLHILLLSYCRVTNCRKYTLVCLNIIRPLESKDLLES